MVQEVKKKTRIYGTAAVLSAIVLISVVYVYGAAPIIYPPGQSPFVTGMKTFSSSQEIVDYLNANSQGYSNYVGGPLDSKFFGDIRTTAPAPMPAHVGFNTMESAPQYTMDHSTTNIQVAGVDEADTVKTDGRYIYTTSTKQNNLYYYDYYSSGNTNAIYILDADPQNAKVLSKISLENNTQPAGLFLSSDGSKLVVIASKYQVYALATRGASDMMPSIMPYYQSDVYTYINVYDVTDKANPTLARNYTMSGSYFNSRMIGNNIYIVTSQSAVVYNGLVTLPAVYEDRAKYDASPSSIYYADMNATSFTFTSFYGFNVIDSTQQLTNMTVMMGGASTMYVSPTNIYVTYPDWDQNTGSYTSIYRVAINGLQLTFEAQGSVPGSVLNQYSMDEYSGYFRVATNWWSETQISNVYVLNSDLNVTGKLEGLAPNENLHSVRFMGDKCYLVTFQTTDPLFVIDLSAPSNPKVLGELKIPGYSDYLHPYDQTHLIGVGKEAIEAQQGNFAWYQGLKLALFDVTDVNNPQQLSSYGIGDRGTDSTALQDPKAFLFDKTKNLLVIPVSYAVVSESDKATYGDSAYGQTVWQGAYVFSVSLNGGFEYRGRVTHLDNAALDNPDQIWQNQNSWVTRALYIDNTLYTISNAEVKLNSLSDLSETATINLA